MAKKEAGAGLGPSTYSVGGGLLNDVDAEFKEVRFEHWDYNGKVKPAVPALKVVLELEDGEETDQYWSAGNADDWTPSDDGTKLVPVGNATQINANSNMAYLVNSIVEAGFPEDKIEDDCRIFEGLRAHMIRIPAPKRVGLVKTPRADGRVFEDTILVVDTIETLPWEKKGKAAPKKGKEAEEPEEEEADEVDTKATETVMEILNEEDKSGRLIYPDGLEKKKLAAAVFQKLKKDSDRNAVVQRVYQDEFLESGPWNYEKGIVGG